MTIQQDPDDADTGGYTISITCNESLSISNNVYAWGSQPGLIPQSQRLELVNDTYNLGLGPAWFKMVPFNKTIVLPEQALTPMATATSISAARLARSAGDLKRKAVAQPGDKVWVCAWPETFLEIFIYPMQNSTSAKAVTGPGSSSWPSSTPGPSTTSTTDPGATPVMSTRTNGQGKKRYLRERRGSGLSSPVSNPVVTTVSSSGAPSSPTDIWAPSGSLYPRVVKIEERRVYRSPTPSCQQVEIQKDGQAPQPVKDGDGNDVVIYIVENESSPAGVSRGVRDDPLWYRDTSSDMSKCGCIWLTT
jgi:hypothetical protein